MRFENLKDGQMDMLSLGHGELEANKKCQDWAYKFESNQKNEITEPINVDKSMQSKRGNSNKVLC